MATAENYVLKYTMMDCKAYCCKYEVGQKPERTEGVYGELPAGWDVGVDLRLELSWPEVYVAYGEIWAYHVLSIVSREVVDE